jgi:hypothetical protein
MPWEKRERKREKGRARIRRGEEDWEKERRKWKFCRK